LATQGVASSPEIRQILPSTARKNSENETGPAAGLCHPERSEGLP
jgi:hypothetical protein